MARLQDLMQDLNAGLLERVVHISSTSGISLVCAQCTMDIGLAMTVWITFSQFKMYSKVIYFNTCLYTTANADTLDSFLFLILLQVILLTILYLSYDLTLSRATA